MFGSTTAAKTTTASSNRNTNGLLTGYQWASTSVSYSFTDNYSTDYESGYPDAATHRATFRSLSSAQRSAARSWIAQYNNVSYLNLYELSGTSDRDATMRIAMSNDADSAYAYNIENNSTAAGDIFFNTTDYNTPTIGSSAYRTFGHEIGHALGLKHGHETGGVSNVALTSARDSMEFSIMTYRSYVNHNNTSGYTNASGGYAQSLMMDDIQAIQYMYGAWFGYNSSNTTYSFSTTTGEMFVNGVGQGTPLTNTIFRTIWDGNGTDTYDFSNYSTNLWVDLTPGSWSDLDTSTNFQAANLGEGNYARGQVFNALQSNNDTRSLIENANGGSGHDVMVGNNANNLLVGNNGYDYIDGGYGDDTLRGGAGNDYLVGGWGNDFLDSVGGGVDTLIGGMGDDLYTIYNRANTITENAYAGTDTVWAADSYTLAANVENMYLVGSIDGTGNSENNTIVGYGLGTNVIYGGGGHDFLMGGAGNDHLVGGSGYDGFYFSSLSEGADNIYDFVNGVDKIYISAAGFGGGLVAGRTMNTNQFFTQTTTTSGIVNTALYFDADGYYGAGAAIHFANVVYSSYITVNDLAII